MFQRNYLLDYLRQDGRNALIFCLLFAAAGLYPWLGMEQSRDNAALRFAGATAAVMSLLGLGIASPMLLNPKAHHTVQDLKRYGPVDQVLQELQADFTRATRYSRLALGPLWLTARGVGITVVRREEITAAELAETRLHMNGASAGSNWRLVVTTRDGRVLDFPCRNRQIADTVLALIQPEA
ncbi:hypothetical protein ABS71_19465 [bacterium SCN 62-11]|nr:hypothetical protein [Candidatus Eremiobacteraeota bacterium]ODT57672.1 MAG: hypothetical protein ABS71_19465 [bacterium SCN 62-11]